MAAGFLFVGVSFKNDFFEIAKQIEIFTGLFKTVNQNYVDETNPGEMMDNAIKNMLKELFEILEGQDYSKFEKYIEGGKYKDSHDLWISQFDGSGIKGWWD